MSGEQSMQCFSTDAIPQRERFDCWMNVLRQSLWPVSKWSGLHDLEVQLREAHFGCVTSMAETITAHQSHRTWRDVEISGDRCYLLFANKRPWVVSHHGHQERYLSGDVVVVDSQGELETSAELGFDGIILKLPVSFLRTWLPDPDCLVGKRIPLDSQWGQVLSPVVSELTPQIAAAPPLPHSVMVDQVGAVLALVAGESQATASLELLKTVRDRIRERCCEPELTAADVAVSLRMSPRRLHGVLASSKLTFASQLLEARVNAAVQMLSSSSYARLTVSEIAGRSGFLSASHFARVVRKRTGRSPIELRHQTH